MSESTYLNLLQDILENGKERPDRTGVGTVSVFARQLRFDISQSVPLLTTKALPWKHCIEELLWFLRGDTDTKILNARGVKIWNANTTREALDARGLDYPVGVLGPGYGWQWRFYGATYYINYSNGNDVTRDLKGYGFDQINHVLKQLKTDPFSRRHLVVAWNPIANEEVALEPCHYAFQFYVEEDSEGVKWLSCHFNMRSTDTFLGLPWNIFSYTVLTYVVALKTGMRPKELVYTGTDVHIYKNHIEQVKTQLERIPRSAPTLELDPSIITKDWSKMSVSDFKIVGYNPCPSIKAEMAV